MEPAFLLASQHISCGLTGRKLDPEPLQKDPAFAEASSEDAINRLAHRCLPFATAAAASHVVASRAENVQDCITG